MQIKAKELAALLNGSIEGDSEVVVSRPSKIEEGGEGSISFLGNAKYEKYAYSTTASILLVNESFQPTKKIQATLIRVADVYAAVAVLMSKFSQQDEQPRGVSALAFVDDTADVADNTAIGRFCVVEKKAKIGEGSILFDQVYIGSGVSIGKNTIIHPGVRILKNCSIGNNCVLHANVVIGSDGFGFVPEKDGTYTKITHVGNVLIEDDVEIGANTTVDRATMGSTIIRKGVKLDNLIQLGHNTEVDENTVIAAQTGVAGSTKIGKHCRIGGQVGFAGHITIADKTMIQAQSGIAASIEEEKTALFGSPAIGYRDYIRSYGVFKKLPDLYKQLHRLEKEIENLKRNQH